ncbi:hypothetical protein L6164_019668 [Bauhinia variegata]|uniref:Uncharacterized protein n=1 Tax=Bauhinia variegata TaxID=167791 RepID=A0ACB9MTY3_BAUVA|nr:hypothetical protein L6164_019668 [Bauhinia variegata]
MAVPKPQIEAVLSVPPLNVTEPREVRHVLVDEALKAGRFGGCYNVVLYYMKLNEEDNGLFLAGRIVESLGKSLLEKPILAGRLHRKENGDTEFQLVPNDSGIRLLEARIPMTLSEFLELNANNDLEPELVFWKDIDEQTPEYSPLFYIQVTKFQCGGYTIGISCSLLVSENLLVDNFLGKWTDMHNKMLPPNEMTKTPIFYPPGLVSYESPPTEIITRTPSRNGAPSMVFKITAEDANFNKELAMLCVEEAEQRLGRKMGSEFSLFVKQSSEDIKVEDCSNGICSEHVSELKKKITPTTWEDFGVYEVAFHEGNKPVHVSRWIGSVSEGNVIAIPYPKEGVSAVVIVTLPIENGL